MRALTHIDKVLEGSADKLMTEMINWTKDNYSE